MTFPGYFLSHVNNVSSILLCLPHLDDRPRKHTQLRHQFIPDCVRKEVSTHYYSLHDSPSLYQRLCSSNSLSKMADLCFLTVFFNTESYPKHPDAASLKRTKASKWPTRKNTLSSPRRDTHYCPEKTRRVLPQQLRLDSRKWWIPLPIQNSGRILWCLLRFSSAARILVLRSILWLAYSIISPHAPIHG